jgi:hypothetical protein
MRSTGMSQTFLKKVEIRKLSQLGDTLRIRLDNFLIVEKHPFPLLTGADMGNVVARVHQRPLVF